MMDEHERRWMEQQAALLAEAKVLKEAVKNFSHGELLSLYVILEKMGVAAGSDFMERSRYRTAVSVYRGELMERLNRSLPED